MTEIENGQTAVNNQRTPAGFGAKLTQASSLHVLRSNLDALRRKHEADTPIGHRCSNLIELMQMPELPTHLIRRQMDDLQQLLNDPK